MAFKLSRTQRGLPELARPPLGLLDAAPTISDLINPHHINYRLRTQEELLRMLEETHPELAAAMEFECDRDEFGAKISALEQEREDVKDERDAYRSALSAIAYADKGATPKSMRKLADDALENT